jgi:hypothetical protein
MSLLVTCPTLGVSRRGGTDNAEGVRWSYVRTYNKQLPLRVQYCMYVLSCSSRLDRRLQSRRRRQELAHSPRAQRSELDSAEARSRTGCRPGTEAEEAGEEDESVLVCVRTPTRSSLQDWTLTQLVWQACVRRIRTGGADEATPRLLCRSCKCMMTRANAIAENESQLQLHNNASAQPAADGDGALRACLQPCASIHIAVIGAHRLSAAVHWLELKEHIQVAVGRRSS